MGKYETLNVKPRSKVTISRLAKKHEKSLVDFVEEMANYFDKTGVNPNDLVVLSPAEELKKLRDTIIAFMRKQEKDFILPVFSRVDSLAAKFIDYIDNEAPRSSGPKTTLKQTALKESIKEAVSSEAPIAASNAQIEELAKLKNEHETLLLKYNTIVKYFNNVISNVEYKTTGLNKAPVVNLNMADINGYKEYLNRL